MGWFAGAVLLVYICFSFLSSHPIKGGTTPFLFWETRINPVTVMKKFYLLFIVFALAVLNQLTAQNTLGIEWQYSFGSGGTEFGKKVICTAEGEFVFLGEMRSAGDRDLPPAIGWADVGLTKFSKDGQKKWVKTYGINRSPEPSEMVPESFAQASDGGFIITGNYWTGGQNYQIFVMKVDSTGNLQWEKFYVGQYGLDIAQKSDGSYVVLGTGGSDIIVMGLDNAGNLTWSKSFGGTQIEFPYDLTLTKDGGFVVAGQTMSADGTFSDNPNGNGHRAAFIIKLNAAHELEWSKCYGPGESNFYSILEDAEGNYYVGGSGAFDYESDNARIIKIDKTGNLIWQKYIRGSDTEWIRSIIETKDHSLAISGLSLSTDGDFSMNKLGHRFWVAKIDKGSGTVLQQAFLGGSSYEDDAHQIIEAPDGGFVVVGTTQPNNPFVKDYKGGYYDMWILKISQQFNTIEGSIFTDLTPNGIKDVSDPLFSDGYVKFKRNNTDSVLVSCTNGYFIQNVGIGDYEVSFIPNRPFYAIGPASKKFSYTGYYKRDSFSFWVSPVPGIVDLSINAWAPENARMGADNTLSLQYKNTGTSSTNAVVKFIKDPRTDFVSSPQPFSQKGDTLTLNIADLKPGESRNASITLHIKTPPVINLGDVLLQQVSILHTALDYLPADNHQALQQRIMGAYDPNDKKEITLPGNMNAKQAKDNEYLAYQIRFQNVGNDTAFNIVVRDTIDVKLNINTLEMIAADHSYTMQITQGKFVEWHFNNIQLPDSNVNEPLSHGYFIYRIKPQSVLAIGDTIKNSASIYFDYNLPEKTNVEKTIVVPNTLLTPGFNGVSLTYCSNQGVQKGKLTNPPNADDQATVSIKLDNAILLLAADSSFAFRVDTLSAGKHTIQVVYNNSIGTKTTVQEFSVIAISTPAVDLSANITTITSLAAPVIVSATGTGGGTSPLYTFAKDRNFTTILQSEGAGYVLQIDPSSLAIGDNKIYVRMKTSATCYTDQTNADSILLKRDATTGIIDPENPSQVIVITPNPFRDHIQVSGLNSGKKYLVVLYTAQGQAIHTLQVNNKTILNIPATGIRPGAYWLSIYDGNKKLLGTEKVMKY
jgi:uncharacterized repeat protein (TIGR01451 family)